MDWWTKLKLKWLIEWGRVNILTIQPLITAGEVETVYIIINQAWKQYQEDLNEQLRIELIEHEKKEIEDTPKNVEIMYKLAKGDKKRMIELMREFKGIWYTEALKQKAREEFLKLFPKEAAA